MKTIFFIIIFILIFIPGRKTQSIVEKRDFKFLLKCLCSDSSAAIICCELITNACVAGKGHLKPAEQLLSYK